MRRDSVLGRGSVLGSESIDAASERRDMLRGWVLRPVKKAPDCPTLHPALERGEEGLRRIPKPWDRTLRWLYQDRTDRRNGRILPPYELAFEDSRVCGVCGRRA